MVKRIDELTFRNTCIAGLPVDESKSPAQRQVPGACFARVDISPLQDVKLVGSSQAALDLVDFPGGDKEAAVYLSGSKIIPGSQPSAHCYCGHQFGRFSGQLGDGATMYLGEVVNAQGEKWELQIKGGGKTPFSRTADGRKVMRSSLREFVCSEAMFYLNVPTTRSGSLVVSKKDSVIRDVYYDGNAAYEPCAVVTRIAQTFLRFGSFEICKPEDDVTGRAGPSAGNPQTLKELIDFTVKEHFAAPGTVVGMYEEVVRSSAYLAAAWQCVGFCHGVLNTDNMSIAGLTIDYGPYGFMEWYDEGYICNASDGGGRYRYGAQPEIVGWNLMKLREALCICHPDQERAFDEIHKKYDEIYRAYYYTRMGQKLGLVATGPEDFEYDAVGRPRSRRVPPLPEGDVVELIEDFIDAMGDTYADHTRALRALTSHAVASDADVAAMLEKLLEACPSKDDLITLTKGKAKVISLDVPPRQLQMILAIPHVQQALNDPNNKDPQIDAIREEVKKFKMLKDLAESIDELENHGAGAFKANAKERWQQWLTKYAAAKKVDGHIDAMRRLNPVFIPRQWILQRVIAAAGAGDYGPLNALLERIKTPFTDAAFDTEYADASVELRSVLVT